MRTQSLPVGRWKEREELERNRIQTDKLRDTHSICNGDWPVRPLFTARPATRHLRSPRKLLFLCKLIPELSERPPQLYRELNHCMGNKLTYDFIDVAHICTCNPCFETRFLSISPWNDERRLWKTRMKYLPQVAHEEFRIISTHRAMLCGTQWTETVLVPADTHCVWMCCSPRPGSFSRRASPVVISPRSPK